MADGGLIDDADSMCLFTVAATWFHKRKSLAIGIVASGASICEYLVTILGVVKWRLGGMH